MFTIAGLIIDGVILFIIALAIGLIGAIFALPVYGLCCIFEKFLNKNWKWEGDNNE